MSCSVYLYLELASTFTAVVDSMPLALLLCNKERESSLFGLVDLGPLGSDFPLYLNVTLSFLPEDKQQRVLLGSYIGFISFLGLFKMQQFQYSFHISHVTMSRMNILVVFSFPTG